MNKMLKFHVFQDFQESFGIQDFLEILGVGMLLMFHQKSEETYTRIYVYNT